MHGLTDTQARVFQIVAQAGDGGVQCWQVRDRIFPADSPMRMHRPRTGRARTPGEAGALGNLAAGRILAALADKKLVRRIDSKPYRYVLTVKGRQRAGAPPANTLL